MIVLKDNKKEKMVETHDEDDLDLDLDFEELDEYNHKTLLDLFGAATLDKIVFEEKP